ncbi:MAG: MBL fold metallo-hydrolase [Anaerolineae bacterium]
MLIQTLTVGPLMANCYIVQEVSHGPALVIDPGGDAPAILRALEVAGAEVAGILCTHGHWDHVAAAPDLAKKTGAPIAIHEDEVSLFVSGGGAAWFGLPRSRFPQPDRLLQEGDTATLGSLTFQVWHTPGHSPGSVCLYHEEEGVLFDGDVLFREGIGRSDLPGGSPTLLKESLRRLLSLPDATRVLSGHGPESTIGHERTHNPWLAGGLWW